MSTSLACPSCATTLERGAHTCECGDYYFHGRVRGPTRSGQLRVAGRNYSFDVGGPWVLWSIRVIHEQTPDNGRVSHEPLCPCCDSTNCDARATDYRSLPGHMYRWHDARGGYY